MRESQIVARREDVVVERREVIGGDPDLVPELPRESGARQDRGRKADGGIPNGEELEVDRREPRRARWGKLRSGDRSGSPPPPRQAGRTRAPARARSWRP